MPVQIARARHDRQQIMTNWRKYQNTCADRQTEVDSQLTSVGLAQACPNTPDILFKKKNKKKNYYTASGILSVL